MNCYQAFIKPFDRFTLPTIIPPKMKTTPSHCDILTYSAKMREDIKTATGSSEAVNIVPRPAPVCGIPIENKSGGRTTPTKPRNKPYCATQIKTGELNRNISGKTRKTIIKPPVERSALFRTGGVFFPTVPLRNINVVNVKAANNAQAVPDQVRTIPPSAAKPAARMEPVRRMIIEAILPFVGFLLSNIHSKSVPIHTN